MLSHAWYFHSEISTHFAFTSRDEAAIAAWPQGQLDRRRNSAAFLSQIKAAEIGEPELLKVACPMLPMEICDAATKDLCERATFAPLASWPSCFVCFAVSTAIRSVSGPEATAHHWGAVLF